MKLNKEHRKAFLVALDKAKQDLISASQKATDGPEDVKHWFEIDHYLAQRRITDIEKALIENYIDY